jgi:thiosulfate/3-mercaptopyruvate sulfurtransferase
MHLGSAHHGVNDSGSGYSGWKSPGCSGAMGVNRQRSGLMSINGVPTASLVDPATGHYFDQQTIEAIFARGGVKSNDEIIAYCGAGIAASNVVFARLLTGARAPAAVFDGSLLEWPADPKRPLVTG